MSEPSKLTVGFVGIGEMGTPMATHILNAGYPLVAYDLRKEALEAISASGARVAPSPLHLARSAKVIITMLPTAAALNEVLRGKMGFGDALGPDHTLIEMSTLDLTTMLQLAQFVEAKGAEVLDCPVGGTPDLMEKKEGEILVSGKQQTIDKCLPVLKAITERLVFVGKIGNGKIMKLANNLLVATSKLAVTETITFALRNGIPPEAILEAISGSNANSTVFKRYGRAVLEEDKERIASKHSWQLKDLGLLLQTAKDTATPLLLGERTYEITKNASKEYSDAENFLSIVKYYKEQMRLAS